MKNSRALSGKGMARYGKYGLLAAILIVLVLLPNIGGADYLVSLATLIMSYMALGQMWNLLGGYAGLLSLGMQAFIGIGGVLSVLFGLAVSPALFKVTGVYFAIGTWVVAEALMLFFSNWSVVNLAFKYGKAKGYRAAKAEGRAAV